jgi:surface polysaccharide O-acyltransferase-like enzyme
MRADWYPSLVTASDSTTTAPSTAPTVRPRSVALDVLRVVAILGVVAIHTFAGIVTNPAVHGSGTWWVAVALDIGNVWVIPVFVMVSGALLLGPRAHSAGPRTFYRKRLLRLGPAFVAWQVFYIVVVQMWLSQRNLSITDVLQQIADGKTYTHLYFLYLIVGLYLVAPVLAAFLAGGGPGRAYIFAGTVLASTLLVYVIADLSSLNGAPRPIVLGALTQWMPYVGYFLAGWALRNVTLSWRWATLAAVATLALLAETVWQYANAGRHVLLNAISPVGYLSVVVAAASIGVFVVAQSIFAKATPSARASRVLRELSDAAFGVFLVHFFFLVLIGTLFPSVAQLRDTSVLWATAYWACVVIISFAVTIGARRVPFLRRVF